MYWDSTGDWRLTYYSDLAKKDVSTLSIIENAELELDLLEKKLTQKLLNSKHQGAFLDIGCGVGRQILEFSEEWKNIQFWGIDISEYQIDLLNNIVHDNQMGNVVGIAMDAANVDSIDKQFDIISFYNNAFGCLNFDQQIKCLNEIDRLLLPGGYLLISCFDRLELIEQSYLEWGLPPKYIDYTTGIVDLGDYQSNWKTADVFLPYFAKYSTFNLEYYEQSGLGTVYIFKKSRGGDFDEVV